MQTCKASGEFHINYEDIKNLTSFPIYYKPHMAVLPPPLRHSSLPYPPALSQTDPYSNTFFFFFRTSLSSSNLSLLQDSSPSSSHFVDHCQQSKIKSQKFNFMFITEEMACQSEIGLALCNVVTFISIAIKNGEIIKPNTFC